MKYKKRLVPFREDLILINSLHNIFFQYATFNVYMMMVYTLFPIFFSFYLGSWCDIFGRKLLIKIYLMSKILAKCGVIVLAYFMNSSKYWILLCSIPYGIAGNCNKKFITISKICEHLQ